MPTMDGIDVSKWQNLAGPIKWTQVAATPAKYCFVKMSGTTTPDPHGKANLKNARNAGLLVGGYHFLTSGASGTKQAEAFLNATDLKPGDLLPVLDVETPPTSAAGKKAYVKRCEEWLDRVALEIGGKRPFIYTRKDIMTTLGNPASLRTSPLWLARYSNSPPAIPTGFSTYIVWQYSESGSVNGITGNVDLNQLNVPFAKLKSDFTI